MQPDSKVQKTSQKALQEGSILANGCLNPTVPSLRTTQLPQPKVKYFHSIARSQTRTPFVGSNLGGSLGWVVMGVDCRQRGVI